MILIFQIYMAIRWMNIHFHLQPEIRNFFLLFEYYL